MAITLEVIDREITGKQVYRIRQANKIPAVFYGHGTANKNLAMEYVPFEKVYKEAGENTIIDLTLNGAILKALIADISYEPIKGRIAHVDFKQVRMDEEITAMVTVEFVGECKLVKEDGGVLVHNVSELEIKCLPGDLIHEIEVDISGIVNWDDVISIKDLKLPSTVEIIGHDADDVIAMVSEPKVEEEAPVVVPEAAAAAQPVAEGKEAPKAAPEKK